MNVRDFLTQHGLAAYVDAFEAQTVAISDLADLTDDELRTLLGMANFSDRKRFKAAIASLSAPASALSGATRFESPTPTPLSGATRFESPPPAPLSGPTRMAPTPVPSLSGPTRVEAASALPDRLGSYRVLGLLGVGGMGTVVRARHSEEGWAQRQGGDVAIKLIHPQIASDATFRDRFFSEAELGRRVQHPGLVPTFDVIAEGAWLGTVMSLVVGEPLTTQVVPGGMALDAALALLTPIAEVLDYLHGQGVVHRDLKPANILVRPDGRPVVLDLGIAKDTATLENHTRTMTAMGTSAWMAPEQADAKHVDGAADRYALGMIAYALLAGRLPWEDGTSEARMLVSKLTGQLVPLVQLRAGLPSQVTAAVMKMVSLEAEGRYLTCAAFVGALKDDGGAVRAAAAQVAAVTREAEASAKAAAKRGAAAEAAVQAQTSPSASGGSQFVHKVVADLPPGSLTSGVPPSGATGAKLGIASLAVLAVLVCVGGFVSMGRGESSEVESKDGVPDVEPPPIAGLPDAQLQAEPPPLVHPVLQSEQSAPAAKVDLEDNDEKGSKAPRGEAVLHEMQQVDREIANNAGILGALKDDATLDSALGATGLNANMMNGIGGLIGSQGTQMGSGGLGARGGGIGGTAEGSGGLGTKGRGSGSSGSGGGQFGSKGEGGIGTVGGDPIILGALDKALIDAVIKRNMASIRYCYQKGLTTNSTLGGKIIVKFVIVKDGTVSSATTGSSTMGNPAVESCINGRFQHFQFPEPKGGGIVIVKYPFIFAPA